MTDMHDSGRSVFKAWSKQTVSPNGLIWWNNWLGEFDPDMSGAEADIMLHGEYDPADHGRQQFIRGWDRAREEWRECQ